MTRVHVAMGQISPRLPSIVPTYNTVDFGPLPPSMAKSATGRLLQCSASLHTAETSDHIVSPAHAGVHARDGSVPVDPADLPVGAPAVTAVAAVGGGGAAAVAAEPVGVNPEHVHVGLVDGLQAELVDEDVDLNPVDVDRRV
jgi:hypothetical protein